MGRTNLSLSSMFLTSLSTANGMIYKIKHIATGKSNAIIMKNLESYELKLSLTEEVLAAELHFVGFNILHDYIRGLIIKFLTWIWFFSQSLPHWLWYSCIAVWHNLSVVVRRSDGAEIGAGQYQNQCIRKSPAPSLRIKTTISLFLSSDFQARGSGRYGLIYVVAIRLKKWRFVDWISWRTNLDAVQELNKTSFNTLEIRLTNCKYNKS